MGVKLYAADFSPPVRSSMMALDIFNVPYEKITLDLLKMEHHNPEYIQKNPLHTIPVLEDGDLILHDSHAIMAYLADTYGKDESWYPKDVKKRALVNQKLFFTTGVIFPRLRIITYYLLQKGRKSLEQEWLDNIEEAIGFVEQFLSRTKFIALDHVTIADVTLLSHLTSVEPILPIDAKKYPKTIAWLELMKATPYCKKYNEEGVKSLTAIIKHAIGEK
nr:glutathione S-transferase epsilon 8 [Spodoptera exigua]